jgi:hypothetical protein
MHRWNATFVVAATLMAGFLVKMAAERGLSV